MNSTLKKLIAVTLMVMMCLTGLSEVAFAADKENLEENAEDLVDQESASANTDCGEQLTWSINGNGVLTISGVGNMKEWSEESPTPWCELADSVKEIQVEDDVTTIGSYAFAGLINAEKVTIGSGVNSIGKHAFSLCGDENTAYIYNGTEIDWSFVNVGEDNNALDNITFLIDESEETLVSNDEAINNQDQIIIDTEGTEETEKTTEDSYGVVTLASNVLDTPALGTATASSGVITVTWSAVSEASGYRVYRKTSGGSWAAIGNTEGISYADKKAEPGTTYYYTVRAYKGDYSTALANTYDSAYWSDFVSGGISAKATGVLSTPSLKSAAATAGQIKVTWSSVSGASGYRIYRKKSGSSWSAIGYTTGTSYTDSNKLDVGTTYYYTVRAYKGDYSTALANAHYAQYWSDFVSAGVSAKAVGALSTPSLKNATATAGQIVVTWSSVSGASGYRVYRKTSGSSWAAIGYTTGSTSYTDTNKLDVGTTYYYTVRAYKGDYATAVANAHYAEYWSDFVSAGVSDKAVGSLSTPSLKGASSNEGKITVTWNSVSGASGYRVYRKTSSSSWAAIGYTTGSTSYTDEKVDADTTYYYTVRAYKGDYSTAVANAHYAEYWSDFVSAGVSEKAVGSLSTPTLKSAKTSSGNIVITWDTVSGAKGYRVYRKTSSGSWGAIGTTTSTSYTDSNVSSGTTYFYTVRAYKGDKDTALANAHYAVYWSGFDSTGVTPGPGIVKNGSSYYYVADDGIKVTTTAIQQAVDFVVAHTTDSWSSSKKLETCFNYMHDHYDYTRDYATPKASDLLDYASYYFTKKTGNCYKYAAASACIIKVLGYDARVAVGSIASSSGSGMSAHGWAEVYNNGTWYMFDVNMNVYMKTQSQTSRARSVSARYTLTASNGKASFN